MLYGSVLWLLVHVIMIATPETNLRTVWGLVKEGYNYFNVPNPDRLGTLKMTMFTTKSGAKLRGKAAEVRESLLCLHVFAPRLDCLFRNFVFVFFLPSLDPSALYSV